MIPILVPKFPKTCSTEVVEEEADRKRSELQHSNDSDVLSVAFPSVAFSNTLFFSSAYNVQVVVGDDEPEDKLVSRFRREVLKAGVIQECKRRRYFETPQEKRKRKIRDAAKRNRRRKRPQPKPSRQVKADTPKKVDDDAAAADNWELFDVDLPYTK